MFSHAFPLVYPAVRRERFGAFGVSIFPIYSLCRWAAIWSSWEFPNHLIVISCHSPGRSARFRFPGLLKVSFDRGRVQSHDSRIIPRPPPPPSKRGNAVPYAPWNVLSEARGCHQTSIIYMWCMYVYIYIYLYLSIYNQWWLMINLWNWSTKMENMDFPMKASIYSGFSIAMLNNQMVMLV